MDAPRTSERLQGADISVIATEAASIPVSDDMTGGAELIAASLGDMWTLDEAIRKLGITRRTAFRKLKNGDLTGWKVQGPYGLEWRIDPVNPVDDSHPVSVTTVVTAEPETTVPLHTLHLIEQLQAKLEGATYRIGYLESKLEDRDYQIKLLTDSQHKPGWWAKLSNWFFKAQ
jgi:hypothetical protein